VPDLTAYDRQFLAQAHIAPEPFPEPQPVTPEVRASLAMWRDRERFRESRDWWIAAAEEQRDRADWWRRVAIVLAVALVAVGVWVR
jgi:cytochrome c556